MIIWELWQEKFRIEKHEELQNKLTLLNQCLSLKHYIYLQLSDISFQKCREFFINLSIRYFLLILIPILLSLALLYIKYG